MPAFVTPDILTGIGMGGSLLVAAALWLAHHTQNKSFLFLAILGFAIQWFGDSLDGRIAYFRNIPRKWYGFTLDCIMDWLSITLMSVGFYIYLEPDFKVMAFLFAAGYAWAMIMVLLRYKITNKYLIDPGPMGPTEARIVVCLVIFLEILFDGSIKWFTILVTTFLLITNFIDTFKTVKLGDQRDLEEKQAKA